MLVFHECEHWIISDPVFFSNVSKGASRKYIFAFVLFGYPGNLRKFFWLQVMAVKKNPAKNGSQATLAGTFCQAIWMHLVDMAIS